MPPGRLREPHLNGRQATRKAAGKSTGSDDQSGDKKRLRTAEKAAEKTTGMRPECSVADGG
jgi:hypothetical protein